MARAVRMYQIIYAGRDGVAPEEVVPPMNEDELKLYKSVREETEERRAKGLPPYMYEIPIDAFDDEDGIEDIYPDDFDEKVVKELEKEQ